MSEPDHGRPLPPDVAAELDPAVRRALDHPARRAMLRALAQPSPPTTFPGLAAVVGVSISRISYHAMILEECGLVSLELSLPNETDDGLQQIAFGAPGDDQVRRALNATRALDDEQT